MVASKNINFEQKALVVGGGPTGMFTALKLLEGVPNSYVKVVEKRPIVNRPQVVQAAFYALNSLPDTIKRRMWPVKTTRDYIFGLRSRDEPTFWPYTDYRYLSIFQIGELQRVIRQYIEETYGDRFNYEVDESFDVEKFKDNIENYDLVVISTGNSIFAQEVRKDMKIYDFHIDTREEVDARAMYLVYQSDQKESFERNGNLYTIPVVGAAGLVYGHSNDSSNNVQIYTYPVGDLREIFADMPQSIKAKAAFPYSKLTFNGQLGDEELSEDEKNWFEIYSATVKKWLKHFDIPYVAEDKIKCFFATRSEYYYDTAATYFKNVPVMFVGDAAGTTDFKLGTSLGRGLLSVKHLTDEIERQRSFSFEGIVDYHNKDWSNVIETEFNKNNPRLTRTPPMIFKYFVHGRTVDGKLYKWEDKEDFMKELIKIENSEEINAQSLKQPMNIVSNSDVARNLIML